jgi:hypothetical protein
MTASLVPMRGQAMTTHGVPARLAGMGRYDSDDTVDADGEPDSADVVYLTEVWSSEDA